MNYTNEDYNFIKSWLNKCVTINTGYNIYYITSDNIVRQLKYNQLLNKKDINVDLTKINYKYNIIIKQNLKHNYFLVNYNKIWSVFNSKYHYYEIKELINNVLYNIFELEEYTSITNPNPRECTLYEILNFKQYTITH